MKTKPTGIRFDIDDLELIKHRENLKTPQQVVSFLCSEYCKMYRIKKPSVFQVKEREEIQPENETTPPISELRSLLIPKQEKPRTFNDYIGLKAECESIEAWEVLQEEIKMSSLSDAQKKYLIK